MFFLNLNASGGIISCKDKTSSWHLIGFPDGNNIGSTVNTRGGIVGKAVE